MSLPSTYTVQMTGLRGPDGEVTEDLAALEANVVAKAGEAAGSATTATTQAGIATAAASSFVVGWNGAAPIIDRANARMKFAAGYFRQRGAGGNTTFAAQNLAWLSYGSANVYYLDTTDQTIKVLASGAVPAVGNQFVILGVFWNGTWTPFNTPAALDSEGSLLNLTSFAWSNEVLVDLNDTLLTGAPSIYVPLYPRYVLSGGGLVNAAVTNAPVFNPLGGYCRIAVSTAITQQVIWYDPGDNTVKLATNPTKPQSTGTLPGVRIIEFTGSEETIRVPMGVKWRSLGKRQQNNKASLKARLRSENHSVVLAHIGDSNSVAEGADAVDTLTIPASAPYTVNLPVYGQRGFTSVVANGTTLTRAAAGASPTANQYQSSDWAAVNDQKGRTLTFDSSRAGQTVIVTYNPEIAPRGQNVRDMRFPRSAKTWVRQMGRQMASIACGGQNEAFVSKTEALTVASGAVTLAYCPAPDTLTISGYTEIFGPAAPAATEFKVSTSTPGQLIFNTAANGAALSITYGIAAAVRYYRDNPVGTATSTGAANALFSFLDANGLKQTANVYTSTSSAYGAMLNVNPNLIGYSIEFPFTGDRFDITHVKFSDGVGTWQIYVDDVLNTTVNMNVDGTTAFGHVTSVTGLTFGYHRVRLVQQSTGSNLRIEAITFRKYFEHWNLSSYGSNSVQWTSGASNGLLAAAIPTYATDCFCMIGTNDRGSTGTNGRGAQITKYGVRNMISWLATNRARVRVILILPPKAFGTSDIYANPGGFYSSSDDIARALQEIADEFGLDTLSYYDVTARYEIEFGSLPTAEVWPNGLHFLQAVQTEVAKAFMREFA